jgi:hypothetical protein
MAADSELARELLKLRRWGVTFLNLMGESAAQSISAAELLLAS